MARGAEQGEGRVDHRRLGQRRLSSICGQRPWLTVCYPLQRRLLCRPLRWPQRPYYPTPVPCTHRMTGATSAHPPPASAAVLLELPVAVVERADLSGLEPSRDAVEMEGVLLTVSARRRNSARSDSHCKGPRRSCSFPIVFILLQHPPWFARGSSVVLTLERDAWFA